MMRGGEQEKWGWGCGLALCRWLFWMDAGTLSVVGEAALGMGPCLASHTTSCTAGAAARASTLRAGGEGARMDARTQEPAQSAWGLGWSRVLQGQDPEDGDGLGSGPPPAVASAAAAAGQVRGRWWARRSGCGGEAGAATLVRGA